MNIPALFVWYKALVDAMNNRDQQSAQQGNSAAAHVVSGGAITLPGGMQVTVAAALVRRGGTLASFAGATVTLTVGAAAPNSRVDLVYIDNTGTLTFATGNAADPNVAPGPQDPALPAGACLIAVYLIPAGTATLTSSMQADARMLGPADSLSAQLGVTVNGATNTWVDLISVTGRAGVTYTFYASALINQDAAAASGLGLRLRDTTNSVTFATAEFDTPATGAREYTFGLVGRRAIPTAADATVKLQFITNGTTDQQAKPAMATNPDGNTATNLIAVPL